MSAPERPEPEQLPKYCSRLSCDGFVYQEPFVVGASEREERLRWAQEFIDRRILENSKPKPKPKPDPKLKPADLAKFN